MVPPKILEVTAFHVTPECNLDPILREGLLPGSSWCVRRDLVEYYCSETDLEREAPIILAASIPDLISASRSLGGLRPDISGLDIPLTGILGISDAEILTRWANSSGKWFDSAEIVGSLICPTKVPGGLLTPLDRHFRPIAEVSPADLRHD